MKMKFAISPVKLTLCLLAAGAVSVPAQGNLTPPGAPAASMKTLDQIYARLDSRTPIAALPCTITNAGSYYLTNHLTWTSGLYGITISANDVAIDLNGFTLNGASGGFSAIFVNGTRTNLTVRNGTVRDWTWHGISASGLYGGRFSDLTCVSNASSGLNTGDSCLVSHCVALGNGNHGFGVNSYSTAENCVASYNGGAGFNANFSVIRDSQASYNGGTGFYAYNYSRVLHCQSHGNTQDGIALGIASHALENTCNANNPGGSISYGGIRTFYQSSHIEGNFVSYGSGIGILVGTNAGSATTGCTVIRNRTRGPTATAYIYGGGNDIGPIGDAATSTSPWANLRN